MATNILAKIIALSSTTEPNTGIPIWVIAIIIIAIILYIINNKKKKK